jgi:hypothetical protein
MMRTSLSSSSAFNINKFLVYGEHDFVLIYSMLGIKKVKSSHYYININDITLSVFSCLLISVDICSSVLLFLNNISDCFFSTCFGFLVKYKMKGLGHRIFFRKNNFVFKLGYSHFIYKQLALDLKNSKKRFKKKPFFAIRGIDIVNLRNAIFAIQSLRLPNCYDKNGIFVRDIVVEWKQGKKGFML